jgi:hypothetical protein
MKYLGRQVSDCTCGGPEGGTGHAPDCGWVQDCDRVQQEFDEAVSQVALQFAECLRECLDEDEMRHVVALNRSEKVKGVCHSHDFCDANEAMAEAFSMCGRSPNMIDEATRLLWNAAWEKAKGAEFDIGRLAHLVR